MAEPAPVVTEVFDPPPAANSDAAKPPLKTEAAAAPGAAPEPTAADADERCYISDPQFLDNLEQLKVLRAFLIQQAVPVTPEGSAFLSFGTLNLLKGGWGMTKGGTWGLTKGRAPTLEEWTALERHTQGLYGLLNESLRRRFLYGQIPTWVAYTAGLLGAVSLVSMFGAFAYSSPQIFLVWYMVWLAALGSLGSIAFIGMNALAVQDDATFDLTNNKLILLRICLGALFGVVLTLPFGFGSFVQFVTNLRNGGAELSTEVTIQSALLLMPFILGFSTPLVIMILNQFVQAVQSFFGKTSPGAANGGRTAAP